MTDLYQFLCLRLGLLLSKVLVIIIRTTLSLNIFALRGRSSNLLSSAESWDNFRSIGTQFFSIWRILGQLAAIVWKIKFWCQSKCHKQAETQVERLQKMVDEVLPGVNDGSGDGQKDILMDDEIICDK